MSHIVNLGLVLPAKGCTHIQLDVHHVTNAGLKCHVRPVVMTPDQTTVYDLNDYIEVDLGGSKRFDPQAHKEAFGQVCDQVVTESGPVHEAVQRICRRFKVKLAARPFPTLKFQR